jgi:aspartyl protease family protein
MLIIALAILIVAVVSLVLFGSNPDILGLEPSVFASIAGSGLLLLIWSGWFAQQLRHDLRNTLQGIAAWICIFLIAIALYAYRSEFQAYTDPVVNRIRAELTPGMPVVTQPGEATIARSLSGAFVIAGHINGQPSRMMFDTGATSVVLTAETAQALGLRIPDGGYRVAVATANGRTTAAPVVLEQIRIGQISQRNVPALVARQGALSENLLGMTFLERLHSYEVRDGRLILRQK